MLRLCGYLEDDEIETEVASDEDEEIIPNESLKSLTIKRKSNKNQIAKVKTANNIKQPFHFDFDDGEVKPKLILYTV